MICTTRWRGKPAPVERLGVAMGAEGSARDGHPRRRRRRRGREPTVVSAIDDEAAALAAGGHADAAILAQMEPELLAMLDEKQRRKLVKMYRKEVYEGDEGDGGAEKRKKEKRKKEKKQSKKEKKEKHKKKRADSEDRAARRTRSGRTVTLRQAPSCRRRRRPTGPALAGGERGAERRAAEAALHTARLSAHTTQYGSLARWSPGQRKA